MFYSFGPSPWPLCSMKIAENSTALIFLCLVQLTSCYPGWYPLIEDLAVLLHFDARWLFAHIAAMVWAFVLWRVMSCIHEMRWWHESGRVLWTYIAKWKALWTCQRDRLHWTWFKSTPFLKVTIHKDQAGVNVSKSECVINFVSIHLTRSPWSLMSACTIYVAVAGLASWCKVC